VGAKTVLRGISSMYHNSFNYVATFVSNKQDEPSLGYWLITLAGDMWQSSPFEITRHVLQEYG